MPRHIPAMILLGGWVALLPPMDGAHVNPSVPITQWEVYSAYDTARECEEAQHWLFTNPGFKDEIKTNDPADPEVVKAARRRLVAEVSARWAMKRCVPAESVYPPQSPAQK